MKNWREITNEALHSLTLNAAKSEKSATLILLEHLAEIDRRRLYAEMGFPSLWIYVHELLGYSESQTTERVSAMRLMIKIPEVKKELEAGKISLTTTAKLATHVRREKTGTKETLSLLAEISGKTSREVEQHLAKNSLVEYQMDKYKVITSKTTRIIIDVDQEFLDLMNRVRELKGNLGSSTQDLLKVSMQNLVKRNEVKQNTAPSSKHENELRAAEVKSKTKSSSEYSPDVDSRYIPARVKNEIRLRSGDQCEFVDQSTQRRCTCKTKLEFDHIIPFMLGGQTSYENLRHYCPSHNKLSAIKHYGGQHMNPFLKN